MRINSNNPINNSNLLKNSRLSSQSMKNVFLNTNNLNNNEKRNNVNYIQQRELSLNDNKFFKSRNLSNNFPIKLLSLKNNNLKPLFSTSSYNSSLINENDQRHSIESNDKLNWKKVKNNNNEKNENSVLKINNDLNIDKNSFHKFIKNQSVKNICKFKNDFIPIFKKRKSREGKKKKNKNKRQLSKISESSKNELNEIQGDKYNTQKKNIDITKRRNGITNIFNFNETEEENDINFFSRSFGNPILRNYKKSKTQKFLDFLLKNVNFKQKTLKEKMKQFFEEEIEENLNIIDSNNFQRKNNYIQNIQEEIKINLECIKNKYSHQIENFFIVQNKIRENSFKFIQKKKDDITLNYQPKLLRYSSLFSYKLQKNISFEIKDLTLNCSRVKIFIIKYFEIDLPLKIIDENYIYKDYKKEENSMLENYKMKNKKKLKTLKQKRIIEDLKFNINNLTKKDFYFIVKFYQMDYDYYIIPDILQIKFTNLKFIVPTIRSSHVHTKLRSTLRKSCQNICHSDSQKDKLKILDKSLLKNALIKSNYFERKKRKNKNNKLITIISLKKSYKQLQQRIIERKHTQMGANKLNMISKANELKHQIIKSLNSYRDEIIFYIKDRNYPGFISTFEKYKVDPDIRDSEGNSLLSLAVQSNSFQIVNYLLNAGATPNIGNNNNNTPLHFALTFHNYEIADMLIQRGADEKATNKMGITPWQCLNSGLSII